MTGGCIRPVASFSPRSAGEADGEWRSEGEPHLGKTGRLRAEPTDEWEQIELLRSCQRTGKTTVFRRLLIAQKFPRHGRATSHHRLRSPLGAR